MANGNKHEMAVKKQLEKKGYKVLHRGWPDFLVTNKDDSRMVFVEAKHGQAGLSQDQKKMHKVLAKFNFPVYVCRRTVDYGTIEKILVSRNIPHGRKVYEDLSETHQQIILELLPREDLVEFAELQGVNCVGLRKSGIVEQLRKLYANPKKAISELIQ